MSQKIFSFKGWRYNPEQVSDFSQVVAPPYDVIDPNKLKELQNLSKNNVVWMDLPQEEAGLDKYEVAQKKYEAWKKSGVLIQDPVPCLYIYFQTYELPDGRKLTRKGFFGRRRIESFDEGGVKPHERTFAGPKADRLSLTKATRANLSPIFSLFSDAEAKVGLQLDSLTQGNPDINIEENDGQTHQLWKIQDPDHIKAILQPTHGHPVMIADGHHRYETALNYRELRKAELGEKYTGEEDFNFVLMYFSAIQDPGLVVLPTHRVLAERPSIEIATIRDLLSKYGSAKTFPIAEGEKAVSYMEIEGDKDHLLGWIHDGEIEVWTFDPDKLLESPSLNHLHFAVRDLDVTVLHDLVLEEILGVSKGAQREYGNIHYVKNFPDAIRITGEKNTFGFLMNATKMSQMDAVTEIGETMPQKSTFFYPKLLTGLVFNDLG